MDKLGERRNPRRALLPKKLLPIVVAASMHRTARLGASRSAVRGAGPGPSIGMIDRDELHARRGARRGCQYSLTVSLSTLGPSGCMGVVDGSAVTNTSNELCGVTVRSSPLRLLSLYWRLPRWVGVCCPFG